MLRQLSRTSWLTGFAVLMLFGFTFLSNAAQKKHPMQSALGKKAPPVAGVTLDAKKLDIKSFKGKVVLIDFWATWCPPCRKEIPHLQEAYKKLHDKGLEIISINGGEKPETIKEFIKQDKFQMPWNHILEKGKLSAQYKVQYIPSPFLIDHNGILVSISANNELRGETLINTLEKYVAKIPKKEEKAEAAKKAI